MPLESEMPSGLFGAWVSPVEYIFFRGDLSPMHQVHTQLHELAHFLCGHPTLKISRAELEQVVFENAALHLAALPQLRSPTKAQFDAEAETLANLIQKHVVRYASLDQ